MIGGTHSEEYKQEFAEIALLIKNFVIEYFFKGKQNKRILLLKKELSEGKFLKLESINVEGFLESDLPTKEFLLEIAKKIKHTYLLSNIAACNNIDDEIITYLISSEMNYDTKRNILSNKKTTKKHVALILEKDTASLSSVAGSRFVTDFSDEFQKELSLENIKQLIQESQWEKGESDTVKKSKKLKSDHLHQLTKVLEWLLYNHLTPVNLLITCAPVIEELHKKHFFILWNGSARGGHVTLSSVLENPNLPNEILFALLMCTDGKEEFDRLIKAYPNYKQQLEASSH